jgi:6-pyruvoyltetrahydropterin/6-carboxytetrahydropterin synthase
MFSIRVEGSFSSAHNIRHYKGNCEQLHGHNWRVEVVVARKTLEEGGMVIDFRGLKTDLVEVLEKLDHKYINNIPYFKKVNPTSENIAKYIYDSLKPKVKGLKSITVWENPQSCATYEE